MVNTKETVDIYKCPECGGKAGDQDCPECEGFGMLGLQSCPECDGQGNIEGYFECLDCGHIYHETDIDYS